MKLVTAEAMREADRKTIEDMEFPGMALMENAGMRVTEAIMSLNPIPRRVVILAGPGNNGGDGLVVARHLNRLGVKVSVWCAATADSYKGDALVNLNFLRHKKISIHHIENESQISQFNSEMSGADLVVDALLGTGTGRMVGGLFARLVEAVNVARIPVLAVDIPSGIDANTGEILGVAIKAWWTVTFAFPKRGLVLYPGAEYAGEVTVGEIDIPDKALPSAGLEVVAPGRVSRLLPQRPGNAHKGTFGRALVVAGSPGMSGAAILAGEAALRGGAGLVNLATSRSLRGIVEAKTVELISQNLPEDDEGCITAEAASPILEWAQNCQVLAVGPGLRAGEETYRLLEKLIPESPVPLVLDAGALGALSAGPEILLRARSPVVITPHPGEMAGLTGLKIKEIEKDRLELPVRMARTWNFVAALKGAPTVIGFPDGASWVNPTGGPVLATAGTGDVLTGLITGFISQGLSAEAATLCGVFLHGLAGDIAAEEKRGLKAGDTLLRIPAAFRTMLEHKWEPAMFGPFHRDLRPRVAAQSGDVR